MNHQKEKQHRHHPVFRLMILNRMIQMAVIVLVSLIFLFLFISMASRNTERMQLEHHRDQITQYIQEIERELLAMDYRQRELLNSVNFQQFCFMYEDIDWFTRFNLQDGLYKQLIALRDDCQYVKNAWLHIPGLDKTISDQRVSAPLPDWLLSCTQDGQMQRLKDGSTAYTTTRMEAFTPEKATAYLTVVLDDARILKQLSWLRRSEEDEISFFWDLSAADECAFSKDGRHREQDGYASLCVSGERFPLHVRYVRHDNETDSFVQRIILYCVLFILLVSLIQMSTLFSWYRRIYQPLHHLLIDAFDRASQGDYQYRISIDQSSPFYPIYDSYNHMMEKTDAYVENNLKQQILVNRANLKQLQSQISPHFMYNSYYILYRLIKKGDRESSLRLAEHLGQFYHYVTRNADDEKRLTEEMTHARNYAAIQKFRFRDALNIRIDDPPQEIAGIYVPRLILQPLLENAFKYAYETEFGDGLMNLIVHFRVFSPHSFDIIVENSGLVTDETLSAIREKLACRDDTIETTALVNIHRRLQIYYGADSALSVDRSPLGGLKVCMHIEDMREGL